MSETFESIVVIGSSDCDALGHMNVARYYALCNQNGFGMQTAMGWPPGERRDGVRLSFAVVRAESDFQAEVLAGETLIVRTDIARIGRKSASFRNVILRRDESPVFRSVWHSACLDLDARRATVIPDAFRAALETHLSPDGPPAL
ncbi:acyl-CoA thioesterase [Arenibacterium sp. CAU 1754]